MPGRPPGPTSEYPARRAAILAAAAEQFAAHGFEGASLRAVAAAAGVSPAALYHYFPSKEALMEALMDEVLSKPAEASARAAAAATDLRGLLRGLGGGFMRSASTRKGRDRLEVLLLAAHQRQEWAERYLNEMVGPAEEAAAAAIAAALPEGARGHVSPEWVARQLIGSLLHFVLHEEILRREGVTAPDRDAYLEQVVDLLARGIESFAA
jgi:AcrR family transcriptional regulator